MEFLNWGKVFTIEFDITVNELFSYSSMTETWINVFHFTEKCNKENDGDRIPALFIHNDNGKGKFLVSSYVEGQIKNKDFEFVLGEKYQIKIQQFKDEDNGKFWYQIVSNDEVIEKIENSNPKSYPKVKLYRSSPWLTPFFSDLGSICNVKITPSGNG